MPMIDLAFLQGLIDAVDQSGIDSLEITRAGTRIRISKTPPVASGSGGPAAATVNHQGAAAPAAASPPASPAEAAGGQAKEEEAPPSNRIDVKSPMVGTFYRAPAPDAPPYVEVGTPVSKGQTLCILEAMKLMNELESEVEGTIREVLVENGDPVEYGQILFRIEPGAK